MILEKKRDIKRNHRAGARLQIDRRRRAWRAKNGNEAPGKSTTGGDGVEGEGKLKKNQRRRGNVERQERSQPRRPLQKLKPRLDPCVTEPEGQMSAVVCEYHVAQLRVRVN